MANDTAPSNTVGAVTSITTTSGTINWVANVEGLQYIDYGTTTSYGSTVTVNPALTIANAEATIITASSAAISWDLTANGVATTGKGYIKYGATAAYGLETNHENSFNYSSHSQVISGLTPGGTYHYQIVAENAVGDISTSQDYTFVAGNLPVDVLRTLTGLSTATEAGSFSVEASSTATLAGQSITASKGTVASQIGQFLEGATLTGQAATLSQGTLSPEIRSSITGFSVTISAQRIGPATKRKRVLVKFPYGRSR
jgi:hypothetical protein